MNGKNTSKTKASEKVSLLRLQLHDCFNFGYMHIHSIWCETNQAKTWQYTGNRVHSLALLSNNW